MSDTCRWIPAPYSTPYKDAQGNQFPGWPDEYKLSCTPPGTVRITPSPDWKLCPFCGKAITLAS